MNIKAGLSNSAVIAAVTFAPCFDASAAGYAWFQKPTDTIMVSGQTSLTTTCTLEAVLMLPSSGYAPGNIFNEWTSGKEDTALVIKPNALEGSLFPGGKVSASVILSPDVWHHVAFVADGIEQRIYLDGRLIASLVSSSTIGNGNGLGFIGGIFRDGVLNGSFAGYVESLRVSRVARYAGSSFSASFGDMGSDGDTLLLYNFNDLPGSKTVTDESPLHRSGTPGAGFAGATSPQLVANSSGTSLSVTRSRSDVIISWPLVATNHFLQFATNVTSPILWLPVLDPTLPVGNQMIFITSTGLLQGAFFRLERR